MSTIKALLTSTSIALSGAALVAAASCADEGITHISPRTTPKDHKDAGTTKRDARASMPDEDDDDEMVVDPSTGDDDVGDDDVGDDDVADDDVGDDDVGDDDVGDDDEEAPPASRDAGTGKGDGGKAPDDASGEDDLPACPSGYMCMDPAGPLAAMGLMGTITDQDGKPVAASCSKGGQEMCDPKDPKKSCPNFEDPFCAHVKLTGLIAIEIDQCAQRCTP